jgi:hypothetical protein
MAITTTNFMIPDDGHWHLIVNDMDMGPVMGYTTTLELMPGVYTITAQLYTPDHMPLDMMDTVVVTVTGVYQFYFPVIINGAAETAVAPPAAPSPSAVWLFGLPMLLVGLPLSRRFTGLEK